MQEAFLKWDSDWIRNILFYSQLHYEEAGFWEYCRKDEIGGQ